MGGGDVMATSTHVERLLLGYSPDWSVVGCCGYVQTVADDCELVGWMSISIFTFDEGGSGSGWVSVFWVSDSRFVVVRKFSLYDWGWCSLICIDFADEQPC